MTSTAPKVLVVDDGDQYTELFHALMRDYRYATRCELAGPCWTCPHQEGCQLTHAHDWAETEQALARHEDLDLVLLDMSFDLPASRLLPSAGPLAERRRSEGLRILDRIRAVRRDLPVVLMSSEQNIDLDQRGALGADEYLTFAGESAFDVRALSLLIERILASRTEVAKGNDGDDYVWGQTSAMGRLRRSAKALARTSLPVLLLGETGTGKSALARRVIHLAGRAKGPFVAVDLAAIPDNLMAVELFGSAVGAFSGAVHRPGRFEEADGGTLFLDEVGNLPPSAQRMLLLALQDGKVTRLGETRVREVDVKVVAATNADLGEMVRGGTFRVDLLARLNPAAALRIPPLRERTTDFGALMRVFTQKRFAAGSDRELLKEYQRTVDIEGPPTAALVFGPSQGPQSGVVFSFPASTLKRLRQHAWPGNVRELELLVGNALLMTLADAMSAAEVGRPGVNASRLPVSGRLVADLLRNSWLDETTPSPEGLQLPITLEPQEHLRDVVRELERALMKKLFADTDGSLQAMAQVLLQGDDAENVRRLRTRLQQLGLSVREMRNDASGITDNAKSIISDESELN
ncbi:MAG: DNA-binding NtrC family response regulator [Polyangiales bacterium]|jgi:DNA-binding NtrC family response regulator